MGSLLAQESHTCQEGGMAGVWHEGTLVITQPERKSGNEPAVPPAGRFW
jgi:hypothetical protein